MAEKETPHNETETAPEGAYAYSSDAGRLAEMAARLAAGDRNFHKGGKKDYLPWLDKMTPGTSIKLRILPLPDNDGDPFIIVNEHRGLFPKYPYRGVVCPKSFDTDAECPVCDWVWDPFMKAKEQKNEAVQKHYRQFLPNQTIYLVVFNRDTKKVCKYSASRSLFGEIMTEVAEKGDFTDVRRGFDGKLKCVSVNGKISYTWNFADFPSPLAETEEEIEAILKVVSDHKQEYRWWKTPAKEDFLEKQLANVRNGISEEDDGGSDDDDDAGTGDGGDAGTGDGNEAAGAEKSAAKDPGPPPADEADALAAKIDAALAEAQAKQEKDKAKGSKVPGGKAK